MLYSAGQETQRRSLIQAKYKTKQHSGQPARRVVDGVRAGGEEGEAAVCRSFLFKIKQTESKERSDGADRVSILITSPWTEPR